MVLNGTLKHLLSYSELRKYCARSGASVILRLHEYCVLSGNSMYKLDCVTNQVQRSCTCKSQLYVVICYMLLSWNTFRAYIAIVREFTLSKAGHLVALKSICFSLSLEYLQ